MAMAEPLGKTAIGRRYFGVTNTIQKHQNSANRFDKFIRGYCKMNSLIHIEAECMQAVIPLKIHKC